MSLLKLYKKESTASAKPIMIMAMISGVANSVLLAVMNAAISTASSETLNFRYLMLFLISMALFIIGKRYALKQTTIIVEQMINRVRIRISNKIRNSELLFLENIGTAEIQTRITNDTNLITQSACILISACESSIMLVFCLIYIAIISKVAFLITVISVFLAVSNYIARRKDVEAELRITVQKESHFFELLSSLLKGFKEIKINQKKSDDYFNDVKRTADETEAIKIRTGLRFVTGIMFSEVFFYSLLAAIIFILPRLGLDFSDLLVRIVTAILFIMSPLEMIVSSIPLFLKSSMAVENIYALEDKIDKASKSVRHKDGIKRTFNEIVFNELVFYYADKEGAPLFIVGPINLTIKQGEVIFIIGGNGSGKSTFLKLLTALYYPLSGAIYLDGAPLNQATYQSYRELYSIIFTEFHIFDRLYGIDVVDKEKVKSLLKMMEIDHKTSYDDDQFSNIHLSTGQRKRLALIIALMDDKPIYVFDEWAADQDPNFRKFFYENILEEMKRQGKTIIAASHDDKYFHVADRILKMEYGKIISETIPE